MEKLETLRAFSLIGIYPNDNTEAIRHCHRRQYKTSMYETGKDLLWNLHLLLIMNIHNKLYSNVVL